MNHLTEQMLFFQISLYKLTLSIIWIAIYVKMRDKRYDIDSNLLKYPEVLWRLFGKFQQTNSITLQSGGKTSTRNKIFWQLLKICQVFKEMSKQAWKCLSNWNTSSWRISNPIKDFENWVRWKILWPSSDPMDQESQISWTLSRLSWAKKLAVWGSASWPIWFMELLLEGEYFFGLFHIIFYYFGP